MESRYAVMLTNLLLMLGTFFMWVCRIPDIQPVLTDEQQMQPSEGRSFINYDYYDPDQMQRNSSERYVED